MDLRQVVRYAGASQDDAVARARRDLPAAAAGGFAADAQPHWDPHRVRPTLIVAYRWAPPLTVERRVVVQQHHLPDRIALDAGEMGFAGYVLESQRVVRNVRTVVPHPATAVLGYRYDPELAGTPIAPIPPPSGDPADTWLPVRHLLRPVRVPPRRGPADHARTARRLVLRALGAPRAALGEDPRPAG